VTGVPENDDVALNDFDDELLTRAVDNSPASEETLAKLPRILRIAFSTREERARPANTLVVTRR
jgi:hypothetical protein